MPLEDGTNAEGEDLAKPLPSHWTKENINITLYGSLASPPACRIRALLELAGKPYERKSGFAPKTKTSYSYRKIPVVFVSDGKETRQINDSHIIYKNLTPILFPASGVGGVVAEGDLAIDKEVTYGLMLSCEKEAFSSRDCLNKFIEVAGLTGVSGFLLRNLLPSSFAKGAAEKIAAKNPDMKAPLEYYKDLKSELEKRGTPFFAGDEVGALDASVYGAMCVWTAGGEKNMGFAEEALKKAGLESWYGKVKEKIPGVLEPMGSWPLYC
mmetsp:Transcript_11448/g.14165  ORF Transcript_11448/g.14165 Transcript_11448/m.14165 type:complete len:268 (+) Transcript_11448:66-869(+)|eukprot:CAMPEP_0172502174 /NCGR_PEP_ID=MMETSP1066-20121228/157440_1 /TAXON_ID=671091 /ORGANISM="Coscinodiscus wailesii, Strain CCMP2513" /LENGTH=267 /DNA_ID=CAMNT_0013277335 /DNA_START=66 /DNA_END=869 /DNA_ORIENTATION=-